MQALMSLFKMLAQVTGAFLFLKSNTFSWLNEKAKTVGLIAEAEADELITFAKRLFYYPIVLAVLSLLIGAAATSWHIGWLESVTIVLICIAGTSFGSGIAVLYAWTALFAEALLVAAVAGFGVARTVANIVARETKIDLTTPITAEKVHAAVAFIRDRIIRWAVVVALIVLLLAPFLVDSLYATSILTLVVIALALFMGSAKNTERLTQVVRWSLLAVGVVIVGGLIFRNHVTVATQWLREQAKSEEVEISALYTAEIAERKYRIKDIVAEAIEDGAMKCRKPVTAKSPEHCQEIAMLEKEIRDLERERKVQLHNLETGGFTADEAEDEPAAEETVPAAPAPATVAANEEVDPSTNSSPPPPETEGAPSEPDSAALALPAPGPETEVGEAAEPSSPQTAPAAEPTPAPAAPPPSASAQAAPEGKNLDEARKILAKYNLTVR